MKKEVKGKNKVLIKEDGKTTVLKPKLKLKQKQPKQKEYKPVPVKEEKKKATATVWIFRAVVLLILAGVLFLSYMLLGVELTIAVALLMFVIAGIGFLLSLIKNKGRRKKIISILLILFLICGIAVLSAFCAFMVYIKGKAEPKYENAKLNTIEVSRLYDKDGVEFAKIGEENREKVKYDQLPEVLVDAIIATEDSRFFTHNGFDAPRFLKATIGQLTHRAGAGGASTLTMQVVKNSFTDKYGEKTSGKEGIIRKFEDIYLAVFKLEKDYTKQEIIEYYVNNHFLGGNTYGVQEASIAYFGKSVTDLNLSEAAILAGMFKSPNAYKPTTNPENAAARRKTVLRLMRRHGYITEEEEALANAVPVTQLAYAGTSTSANKYQGYIDTVVDELKDRFGVNPYTTPLLVYTNLDRGRQDAVLAVMNGETYDWKDDLVQGGVAVLESQTGKILAVGNGRNRDNSIADQFNFATEIRRQPGSTAKPLFDYGPGIEYNNWSTAQIFDDAPYTYSNGRSIKNWDGEHWGLMTMRTALKHSRNIPALKAFQSVDNTKIREFVTGLGIEPEICGSGYGYVYDLGKCVNEKDSSDMVDPTGIHEAHAIGAFTGVSPLMMAAAYSAFSNGGYYNEPYSVTKIVYRQSKEEVEVETVHRQVMSDATAYMISSILQEVSLSGGTPQYVACKTGTTNYDDKTMDDYDMPWDAVRDSWVVGYSTQTTIAMWYGYDSLTYDQIQEGYILHNIPATIAKDYFFNALVNSGAMEWDRQPFQQPSSVVSVQVSANNQNPPKLAIPGREGAITELFKKGFEPTEYDTAGYKLPAPGNFKATESNGKVVLSWTAVDPSILANSSHGAFGYNVYKNGNLIDWTDKTTYTYSSNDIYATYSVMATYKGWSEVQSEMASVELKKPKPKPTFTPSPSPSESPDPEPECPEDATENGNTCECNDTSKTYDKTTNTCK